MKRMLSLVLAGFLGIMIGAGMGSSTAQDPCKQASPSPTPLPTLTPASSTEAGYLLPEGSTRTFVAGYDTNKIELASPDKCIDLEFKPQSDITAYELAQILPFIQEYDGDCMTECLWTQMSLGVTRHLQRKTEDSK